MELQTADPYQTANLWNGKLLTPTNQLLWNDKMQTLFRLFLRINSKLKILTRLLLLNVKLQT